MRIGMYLLRRHTFLYSLYWSVMYLVLVGFLVSFEVFGPWILQTPSASAWSLAVNVAPGWFAFVMGIITASSHMPIAIANGVTRRDFSIGAGVFALATVCLFEILKMVGLAVEALVFHATGLMDRLTVPFPWPTVGGVLSDMAKGLGFMLSGWLIALVFYRLRIWWALLLAPLAGIPLSGGMELISYEATWSLELHWTFLGGIVAVSAVVAYLAAQGLAVKPKKA